MSESVIDIVKNRMIPKMAAVVGYKAVYDVDRSISRPLTFFRGKDGKMWANRSAPGEPPKGGPDNWLLRNSLFSRLTPEGCEYGANAAHALGLETGRRTSATLFIKHARPYLDPSAKRVAAFAAETAAKAS